MPRTDPIPSRTATPPIDPVARFQRGRARSDALRSGERTTTPWRRASCASVCGLQKPIGWALSSAAQNAAGSWNLSHDEA